MRAELSRGRVYPESWVDPYRPAFQRDRERIVHARSFRRLTSKTQVLVAQTNDHHRTRLTHSLEVAQVSRTCARMLGLNEDLVEAIALSHDLGHPPYGHAGERALNDCLIAVGGFDHNLHALRIVDKLENPYPAFPGLNLSWEVRSAFAYHSKRRDHPLTIELTAPGGPLLEFQIVDECDSLAYDTHDLDDALGVGVITLADLHGTDFWRIGAERAERRWPGLRGEDYRAPVVRALFEWQVLDLVASTRDRLTRHRVDSVDAVRRTPGLVGFSPEVAAVRQELEAFLRARVYRHPWVMEMADTGVRAVAGLFAHFSAHPADLPERHRHRLERENPARVVGDYLAGMTDRFAAREFRRLCPGVGSVS
ncbi:MAG: deoxyguanosinetriphosphate triphosphohydrolase [Gemmataceae bacterium]|nr:deoxyguanosinetriphosphate triphosphohydrolase [Gemmataceae bacterium]